MNLVIGFGPNLGLALWPRAKPIKRGGDHRLIAAYPFMSLRYRGITVDVIATPYHNEKIILSRSLPWSMKYLKLD